jgi:putative tryptophan/tyrosine transport system substrate-binding protein
MRRRAFITLLGSAAAWPLVGRAQQAGMPVIGFLDPRSPDAMTNRLRAFREGLKDSGFIERENVAIEYRWAENQLDRLPELSAELVRLRVAVLVTVGNAATLAAKATTRIPIVFLVNEDPVGLGLVGSLARPGGNLTGVNFFARLREVTAELVRRQVDVIVALSTTAARPVKQATRVIPIVVVAMADPIEDELVASLARPGENVTGTTFLGPELVAKRLQLLSEVVPQHSRVAVLWHPRAYGDRTMAGMVKEAEHAAEILGMQLQFVPAASPDDIAGAFSAMTRERADALSVFPSPILFAEYGRIASIAADNKLPAIYAAREGVEAGGLMSYGANLPDLARQTAVYVDKILKGAKPGDLPVQQPTKFELVINLKAARALGLTISRDFLLIAGEVIE